MTSIQGSLLVYVIAQIAVGVWVSRRVRSESDYLLAGRSLGTGLVAVSMFATWFGAESCVGAAGEVYTNGLESVSADPFGYGIALLAVGSLIAIPLRRAGYTTVADLFRERFSIGTERCVAILLVPGSVLWAAAQVRAFGQVVASATDLSLPVGLAIAAGVVILYTSLGGILADAYTDLIQGVVLCACLAILAWAVSQQVDLVAIGSAAFRPTDGARAATGMGPWLERIDAWAIPIVGSLFAQELASRILAARSPSIARNAALQAGVGYLLIGMLPVVLGLSARQLLPNMEGEAVLPELARLLLGDFGYVIFAGALLSAILSTVDSALLVSGSLLSHNVLPRHWVRSEAHKLRAARLCVIALGLAAYGLAFVSASVHDLVQEASAFGSAGIVVAGLFGLLSRWGSQRAALSSVLSGAGGWILAAHVLHLSAPYLFALLCALIGYGVGALWDRRASVLELA